MSNNHSVSTHSVSTHSVSNNHSVSTHSVSVSKFRNRALIFDTETTGLFPKKDPTTNQYPPYSQYPHITQLSLVVYDVKSRAILYVYNKYIKVPSDVVIEPIITELTGVTRELLDTEGVSIIEALTEFYTAYRMCDIIAAHNIEFDREMILLEFGRLITIIEPYCPFYTCVFNNVYEQAHDIEIYCTMRAGRNKCNIMVDYKKKAEPSILVPLPIVAIRVPDVNFLTCDMSANDMNSLVLGFDIPLPANLSDQTKAAIEVIHQTAAKTIAKATQYKKMPKLVELYTHLFGEVPTGLHNSLTDTFVCMRCLLQMRFRQEMSAEYVDRYILMK